MRELFFLKLVTIVFKSCACTVIISDIIQVRLESICTLCRFDLITDV